MEKPINDSTPSFQEQLLPGNANSAFESNQVIYNILVVLTHLIGLCPFDSPKTLFQECLLFKKFLLFFSRRIKSTINPDIHPQTLRDCLATVLPAWESHIHMVILFFKSHLCFQLIHNFLSSKSWRHQFGKPHISVAR